MSYPTELLTPLLNQQQAISPPVTVTRELTLVIYNQSPFVLEVHIGSITAIMPAFTADAYPVAGFAENVYFIPIIGSSTNPPLNRVWGIFYLPDEALPYASFPASLTGGPSADDISVSMAGQFAALANLLRDTGTKILDQPFIANDGNITSGIELNPFFNESAAKYQSYTLLFKFSNGAASATNYAQVEIRFSRSQGGSVVWRDLIEINVGNVETYVIDGMHAGFMTLFPTFPGGTLYCLWQMSNRPVGGLHCMEQACNDRILLNHDSIAVAAGATSGLHFVPLFHGPVEIYVQASAAFNYLWEGFFGSLALNAFRLSGAAGADSFRQTLLPQRPLRYQVTNNGGAAATFSTSIWARDNN